MARGNYEDSGRLWPNKDKEKDSQPDWTGELTISRATLRRMKEAMDNGEPMKIRLASWKDDNKPKEISLKVSEPREGGNRNSRGNGGRREGKSYSDSDNERPRRDYDRDDRRQDRDFPGDRAMKRNSRDEPDDDAW